MIEYLSSGVLMSAALIAMSAIAFGFFMLQGQVFQKHGISDTEDD